MGDNETFQVFFGNVVANSFTKGLGIGLIFVFAKENLFSKEDSALDTAVRPNWST